MDFFFKKPPKRVRVGFGFYQKTWNPVIYIVTKIPSYIYIVINPNISYSSFHFSIQLTPPPLFSSAYTSASHFFNSQSHSLPISPLAQLPYLSSPPSLSPSSKAILTLSLTVSHGRFSLFISQLSHSHSHKPISSQAQPQLRFVLAVVVLTPPRPPFFFFSFFWVQFISNSQSCEFVFVFVILKGKIIDLKFVFVISVFMFVIVFEFVSVFVILGQKIINQNLCF